ncbi:hypothetical protein J5Y17_13370 [Celeribacter sp. PS-C1]|nr:hypothetical protein [Celeribacter sp. PS-C1]
MLGVDHIVVFHKNCTDHSPELLQALDAAGILTAVPTPRSLNFPSNAPL